MVDLIKAKQNGHNGKLYILISANISQLHKPLAGLKIYTIRLIHL